jgi:hypothetical protein
MYFRKQTTINMNNKQSKYVQQKQATKITRRLRPPESIAQIGRERIRKRSFECLELCKQIKSVEIIWIRF